MDFQKFIGLKQRVSTNEVEYMSECLERQGYYIFKNVLSEDEIETLRTGMLTIWDGQLKKYGESLLRKIGDYGVCRGMMNENPLFFDLLVHPLIEEILKVTVGETAILHLQNGVCVFPDQPHNQGRYHRDFPRNFISSEILSINTFFVLDHFNQNTGGTWLVPGSHKVAEMPSEEFIKHNEIQVIAEPGSLIVFDSLLWHRGGVNYAENNRCGINNQYTKPFIKQQLDYPVIFKEKIDIESKLAQRLGMWTLPPKSVDEYRVDDPSKRTYRAGQG